jgi:Zn-dependent protease
MDDNEHAQRQYDVDGRPIEPTFWQKVKKFLTPVGVAVAVFFKYLASGNELFRALAYTGFFLNLFNLAPIGFLDGGRIVTALSPWLWLAGFPIMIWLAIYRFNPILILILLFSLPRLFSLFRAKTDEERRYYEVSPAQRWSMAVTYFGLIAFLVYAMRLTFISRESLQ